MKSQVCYMAVQVCDRLEDGRLKSWYPNEKRPTLREAKEDAVEWSREFPGSIYQVIRLTIDEIGEQKVWPKDKAPGVGEIVWQKEGAKK